MEYAFDHENLDVYRLALEVARACPSLRIATGRSRGGDAGRNHYRIAAGSAAEACAALDLVGTPEGLALQPKLRRVGAMLRGLVR